MKREREGRALGPVRAREREEGRRREDGDGEREGR